MLPTSNKTNDYSSNLREASEFLDLLKELSEEKQQFIFGYIQGLLDRQEQDKKTA